MIGLKQILFVTSTRLEIVRICSARKSSTFSLSGLCKLGRSNNDPSCPSILQNPSLSDPSTRYLNELYMKDKMKTFFRSSAYPDPSNSSSDPFQVVQLSNGIRVACDPMPGPFVAVGLLVDTGSRWELPGEEGCTYVLEKLSLKKTKRYSEQQIMEKMQAIGSSIQCTSSRDSLLYLSPLLSTDQLPLLLDLLKSIVTESIVTEEAIQSVRSILAFELMQTKEKPDALLNELAHIKMFQGRGLGNSPLLFGSGFDCGEPQNTDDLVGGLDGISPAVVNAYRARMISPERIIISSVGLSLESLVKATEATFSHWKGFSVPALKPFSSPIPEYMINMHSRNYSNALLPSYAPYEGGCLFVEDQKFLQTYGLAEANLYPGHVHFMLSLPACPSWHYDIYSMAVLVTLLGGGSSFSAGGPGKGLYTRLYARLLQNYGFVESSNATEINYSDAGMFAIIGSCKSKYTERMIRLVVHEMFAMHVFGKEAPTSSMTSSLKAKLRGRFFGGSWIPLSDLELSANNMNIEFERAKNMVKSNLLMGLESRLASLENNLKNVALINRMVPFSELLQGIDSVTIADLQRTRDKMLSQFSFPFDLSSDMMKPLPTLVAAASDLSSMPDYSTLLAMFEEERAKYLI